MKKFLLALTLLVTTPAMAALDREVLMHNDTGVTIVELYGSHVDTDDWQEDVLWEDVIESGDAVYVNWNDGTGYCMFDFLAVLSDGTQIMSYNNNVCELTDFYFVP